MALTGSKTRYRSNHAALAASQVRDSRRPAAEIVGTELVTVGSSLHMHRLVQRSLNGCADIGP
jgi:hypothetical protein